MEKITKKNIYTALVNFAETGTMVFDTAEGAKVEITMDVLKAFAEKEIEHLDKKAAKAKESAAKRKSEADGLMKAVEAVLTDEYETIADIAAKVDFEDATVSKVTYRLNKLVEAGVADKKDLKISGSDGKKGRTVKAYKLADIDMDLVTNLNADTDVAVDADVDVE